MDVTVYATPKRFADEQIKAYNEILKRRDKKYTRPKYVKQMKEMYEHIKKGRKVLDIYEAFKQTGTKDGLPKLAIGRADKKVTVLNNRGNFGYWYTSKNNARWIEPLQTLPSGTFPELKKFKGRRRYEAKVPMIPGHLMPHDDLAKYHILWEVEDWKEITVAPKDPFLLKRISKNLFVILAFWDLTPLERALTRGR